MGDGRLVQQMMWMITAEDEDEDLVDVTIGVEVEGETGKDDEEAETSFTDGIVHKMDGPWL